MGFIDDLKQGLPGVRFAIPDSWKVQEQQDRRAVLLDEEHKVGWHIIHAPWRADFRQEFFEAQRRDIERHARYGYEQHYHQIQVQQGTQRPPVRTADPEFSPLISVEHVTVDGVESLFILRRVAYEPILEAVVGNILIPLGNGLLDITVFQHSQQTGYRESQLLTLALQQNPGEGVPKVRRKLGQAHFDDPAHDDKFPTHPLTCVRKAVRWLLAQKQEVLAVTNPQAALPPVGAELELSQIGCAIKVPPRYQPIPDGVLPVPAGVTLLSRVILEGADDPQMLDVRQIAGVTLAPETRQAKLAEMVQQQIAEWQQNGATNLEISSEPIDPPGGSDGGRMAVAVQVSMLLGGVPTHTVARWLCDQDGKVFRFGVATPPYVPTVDAAADVDFVLQSFRRLPKKQGGAWLTSDLQLAPAKRAQLAAQKQA
jgi:hypothetical protein